MEKQTAVEWLVKEFSEILGPLNTKPMQDLLIVDAIKQAKAMEKEQSEKIYEFASWERFYNGHGQTFEEYWNKTFKSE